MRKSVYEKIFWSIAFPGSGQYLNGNIMKGTIFLLLVILVIIKANLNEVVMLSFHGDIRGAIEQTNYRWILFYPCLYFFSIWDTYKDAGGGHGQYTYLPFVFPGFFVTLGLIFSSNLKIHGMLLGPVWLPIICVFPGIVCGLFVGKLMMKLSRNE